MSFVRKSTGTLQQLSREENAHVTVIAPHETFTVVTAIGTSEYPNGKPGVDAIWIGMKVEIVERKQVELGNGFFIVLTTLEGHGPTLVREASFSLDGYEVKRVFIIDERGTSAIDYYYRRNAKSA